jgi:hypothetical protein
MTNGESIETLPQRDSAKRLISSLKSIRVSVKKYHKFFYMCETDIPLNWFVLCAFPLCSRRSLW